MRLDQQISTEVQIDGETITYDASAPRGSAWTDRLVTLVPAPEDDEDAPLIVRALTDSSDVPFGVLRRVDPDGRAWVAMRSL